MREINTQRVSLVSEMSVLHLCCLSESQLESVQPAVVMESVVLKPLPSRQDSSLISYRIFHRQSECHISHFCIFFTFISVVQILYAS